jgi:hypothetical protein
MRLMLPSESALAGSFVYYSREKRQKVEVFCELFLHHDHHLTYAPVRSFFSSSFQRELDIVFKQALSSLASGWCDDEV